MKGCDGQRGAPEAWGVDQFNADSPYCRPEGQGDSRGRGSGATGPRLSNRYPEGWLPASQGHGRSGSNPPAQTVTSHSGQDHQHHRGRADICSQTAVFAPSLLPPFLVVSSQNYSFHLGLFRGAPSVAGAGLGFLAILLPQLPEC